MTCGIYQLTFPGGQYYIGSSKKLSVRLQEHKRLLIKGVHYNKHLQNTFNKYGKYTESILMEYPEADLLFLEQLFIDTFAPTLNGSRIAGKVEMTPEVRVKMSAAKKGKPLSIEHRQKISEAVRQRPPDSIETRARKSLGLKGIPKSEAHKLKIGAVHKGNKYCVGRKCSSETREKMQRSSRIRWDRYAANK